jgi:hypothetical protein
MGVILRRDPATWLFAFPDERVGELDVELLLDLNDLKPTRLIAPPSARTW